MTQVSRIQPGNQKEDALLIDSGPYSASQWSEMFGSLFTTNKSTQGVLKDTAGGLLFVQQNLSDIDVSVGDGICGGSWFRSDSVVTFTPPATGANSRIDLVVMADNPTGTDITTGIASGQPLLFPNDLTDYRGLSILPKSTCRIVILRGVESASPVSPALDQDPATLFMVPLARYQINSAGTISNFVLTGKAAATSAGTMTKLFETRPNGVGTVTISSRWHTYSSLEIRGNIAFNGNGAGSADLRMRFNGNTGSNYAWIHSRSTAGGGVVITEDGNAPPQ